jgi:Zn-dependent peptidase ImmA (M78 family)
MKGLARDVRAQYGFSTPRVLLSDMRRIYKDQGIRIDLWPYRFKQLRGAYFDDEYGPCVMLDSTLPEEPRIFTMGHELKHHLDDRGKGFSFCSTENEQEPIEIGAEVFSAELIFPEQDFRDHLDQMGVGQGECTEETIVRIKRETRTTLSHTGLAKRATYLGFASGSFEKVAWKKLEEKIYGPPIYKMIRGKS